MNLQYYKLKNDFIKKIKGDEDTFNKAMFIIHTVRQVELMGMKEKFLKDISCYIRFMDSFVVASGVSYFNYVFAKFSKMNIKEHETVILNNDDVKSCFEFARDIDGADIEALGKRVRDLGNAEYSYLFTTLDLKHFKEYEDVILKSCDPKYNCYFASLNGADFDRHEKAVIDSNDPYYNYLFALIFPNSDVLMHEDVVIRSGDLEYNYLFVKNIKGADIFRHGEIIYSSGNEDMIKKYNELLRKMIMVYADKIADTIINGDNDTFSFDLLDNITSGYKRRVFRK